MPADRLPENPSPGSLRRIWRTFAGITHSFASFLLEHGVAFPGAKRFREKLDPQARAALERMLLVREMRGQRMLLRRGPFWLRQRLEFFMKLSGQYRFMLQFLFKVFIALFAIGVPVLIFVVIRGMLPVPSRVPATTISETLPATSSFRTDWPWTEAPFNPQRTQRSSPPNLFLNAESRGASLTTIVEPGAPRGLYHFGIGPYPWRVELLRGLLVSEAASARLPRQRDLELSIAGQNRLRVKYWLFPDQGRESQCRLEIRDRNGSLLLATSAWTRHFRSIDPTTPNQLLKQRLTPASIPDVGSVGEAVIDINEIPAELQIRAFEIADGEPVVRPRKPNHAGEHDVSSDACIWAVGDFALERRVVEPLKRRGILFITVDTMRANTAYDPTLMPALAEFGRTRSMRFLQHRTHGNMTIPSFGSLFTSLYPREIGHAGFAYAPNEQDRKDFLAQQFPTIASIMRSAGYRTAAIGNVSLFTEALQGGVDFGYHEGVVLESKHYDTRQITEEVATWLQNNGKVPFYLQVHYNTFHGPYRPPFEDLELGRLLTAPFGLAADITLYRGLARHWDKEFALLLERLSELGILEQIDIIISSDHGAQMEEIPFENANGTKIGLKAATRDKGHSLWDEEIRVPFFLRIADHPELFGKEVTLPTAHADLLPGLASLIQTQPLTRTRGVNWLEPLLAKETTTFERLLSNRSSHFAEGHRYSSLTLFQNGNPNPTLKYVRQFSPETETLFQNKWPYRSQVTWYQPEQFSTIDPKTLTETWVPDLQPEILKQLRDRYLHEVPGRKPVFLEATFDGLLNVTISIKRDDVSLFSLLSKPNEVHEKIVETNESTLHRFSGTVKNGDRLLFIYEGTEAQLSLSPETVVVGCPAAISFEPTTVLQHVKKHTCFFQPPEGKLVTHNISKNQHALIIGKEIEGQSVEPVDGGGGGALLRQALQDWGYVR